MTKRTVTLIAIGLIIALLNPSREQHIQELAVAYKNSPAHQNDPIAFVITHERIKQDLESRTSYRNYLLFSRTVVIDNEGEELTASIGFLSNCTVMITWE